MPGEVQSIRAIHRTRGGQYGNKASAVETIEVYNNSGVALARGDVVVVDWANSTKDKLAITTTTSGNDLKVLGMVYDPVLAIAGYGRVQIWGPTDALKVDGTSDIAVGDKLATFTTAKIAQAGVTGVFATALEAYTTNDSLGVIDAFIGNLNFAQQKVL